MILLHLVLLALYGYAAWALWPAPPAAATAGSASNLRLSPPIVATWVVPITLLVHAGVCARDVLTSSGLDLSFGHALSLVAGLAALIAWATGLIRTLPAIAAAVLPVAGLFSFLPVVMRSPHPFAYSEAPWAAAHIAIALLAYSLFIVAAVHAVVLMGLERRLHRGLPDGTAGDVPALLTLEGFLFRLVALAFALLTLTVISGISFSEAIFGKPLTFNHKTVFSMLAWFVFGGLLLGRQRYGWRGRRALRWILTGTTLLLLAYFGSKFVLEVLLNR